MAAPTEKGGNDVVAKRQPQREVHDRGDSENDETGHKQTIESAEASTPPEIPAGACHEPPEHEHVEAEKQCERQQHAAHDRPRRGLLTQGQHPRPENHRARHGVRLIQLGKEKDETRT